MKVDMVGLYQALRADERLQRQWERNQPRTDRALESVLIARTPCEVATAALLAVKLNCEPAAVAFAHPAGSEDLLTFAAERGSGGARLARLLRGETQADVSARAAAVHALRFYKDRSGPNELVRLPWSREGLQRLAGAAPAGLINPALRPTCAPRKAAGLRGLAAMLTGAPPTAEEDLRTRLRAVPGLGPERADAAGVFGYHRAWPIVDDYLWRMLRRHDLLAPGEEGLKGYDRRRAAFARHWDTLLASNIDEPNEIAATLYLWACETGRRGFVYEA